MFFSLFSRYRDRLTISNRSGVYFAWTLGILILMRIALTGKGNLLKRYDIWSYWPRMTLNMNTTGFVYVAIGINSCLLFFRVL